MEGEVWQDYKMQTIVHLRSQNIEAWMVKPLSAGCVNSVVACWILITSDYISQVAQRKLICTWTRNRKLMVWYKYNLAHHLVLLANYWQGSSWVPTTMLPGRPTILKTLINRMWGYVILEMAHLLHRRCIMWLARVQSHGSSFFMKGWAYLQGHTI